MIDLSWSYMDQLVSLFKKNGVQPVCIMLFLPAEFLFKIPIYVWGLFGLQGTKPNSNCI